MDISKTDPDNTLLTVTQLLRDECHLRASEVLSDHMISCLMNPDGDDQLTRSADLAHALLSVFEEKKNDDHTSLWLAILGQFYKSRRSFKRASGYYDQLMSIASKRGDQKGLATSIVSLDECYKAIDDIDQTLCYYKRLAPIAEQADLPEVQSHALAFLGLYFSQHQRFSEAKDYLKQALVATRKTGGVRQEAGIHTWLADVYRATRDLNTALHHYTAAQVLHKQLTTQQDLPHLQYVNQAVDSIQRQRGRLN